MERADMVFDLLSFLVGIIVGGLTGALAGVLSGFERTADIQERLLKISRTIDRIEPKNASAIGGMNADDEARMRELRLELDSIHEEIRRMYRKTTR